MPDSEMLIRLVTAAALGSLIGFERERLLWAAGIRTLCLSEIKLAHTDDEVRQEMA